MTVRILSDLVAFLAGSPTPYHAVELVAERLGTAGFALLDEADDWGTLAAGRYYVIHHGTTIAGFVIPHDRPLSSFRIVGAHTDSPNLRLKPKAGYVREGYLQLGVEVYGGALLNSWLDRDLSVAGRLLVRGARGGLEQKLVRIDRPLLRIPQLAIHLDRDVSDRGLVLNRQEHLAPVLGLVGTGDGAPPDLARAAPLPFGTEWMRVVATAAGVDEARIVGSDLMLYDVVEPTIAGLAGEFVFSARLDNLAMCHAGTTALVEAAEEAEDGQAVPVTVLFDHEEIGSQSATGAHSAFLPRLLERIAIAAGLSREAMLRALSASSCVSADMAHAVHPNYPERHEPRHKPVLNGGPVVKINAQQRYATSSATAAMFHALAGEVDVPVQTYVHRTDLPCGSTIGPITASLLGIPTVDVGNPMLSMHSCREMTGAHDPERMVRVLTRYFAAPAL